MIEIGYYCYGVDKEYIYSITDSNTNAINELSLIQMRSLVFYNQWLWHYLRFPRHRKIRILPYHCEWGDNFRIIKVYKINNAQKVALLINKFIQKHFKKVLEKENRILGEMK